MTKEEMLKVLNDNSKAMEYIDGDGHTLYKPEALVAAGFPSHFIKEYTWIQKSDYSNPKYVIFDNNGQPVDEMKAVAALTLHYAVASALDLQGGVDYDDTILGRGTQAAELSRAIRKAVNNV
jgi:hypothetical protein